MNYLLVSLLPSDRGRISTLLVKLCMLVACSATTSSQWYALPRVVSDPLTSIVAYDTSNIVVIGLDGVCLKSSDGGTKWKIVDIPNGPHLGDAELFPNGDIIAVGYRAVYGSSDSGATWRDIYEDDNPNPAWFNGLRDVAVINDSLVWSCGANGLFRSTTSGRKWESVPTSTYGLSGMDWTSDERGFIVGESGLIMRTTDGGASWEKVGRGLTNSYLQKAYFINADSGVVTGGRYDGVILVTTDGGDTWKVVLEQLYGRIWVVSYSGQQWWVSTGDSPGRADCTSNIFDPDWTTGVVVQDEITDYIWHSGGRGLACSARGNLYRLENHGKLSTVSVRESVREVGFVSGIDMYLYYDVTGRQCREDQGGQMIQYDSRNHKARLIIR